MQTIRNKNTNNKIPPRIRPIYLLHTDDVRPQDINICIDSLKTALNVANVEHTMDIINLGAWKHENYITSDGILRPHHSSDYYIKNFFDRQRNQVNVQDALLSLYNDPFNCYGNNNGSCHYDFIITNTDLFIPNTNFVIGLSSPGLGTIVSLSRLAFITDYKLREDAVKVLLLHETGHVFGLPGILYTRDKKTITQNNLLGQHCKIPGCVMNPIITVPNDVLIIAKQFNKDTPYCEYCMTELKKYFET